MDVGPGPCVLLSPGLAHDGDVTFGSSMAVGHQPWKSGCTWPSGGGAGPRALSLLGPHVWPADLLLGAGGLRGPRGA